MSYFSGTIGHVDTPADLSRIRAADMAPDFLNYFAHINARISVIYWTNIRRHISGTQMPPDTGHISDTYCPNIIVLLN